MIKDLISGIAHDKIQLSQALSRAKLIAYKVNNDTFKQWLGKELQGYKYDDKFLPDYRNINTEMFITHTLPDGRKHSKPVMVTDSALKEFHEIVNYFKVVEPISVIEIQVSALKDIGYIHLTAEEAYNISEGDKFQKWVAGGYRKMGKGQLQNIIELTKQKLLDTLLELDNLFPDLKNEFKQSKENIEKVHNIITNNIYGNNNPLNIAAGVNVEQKEINNTIQSYDYSELKKLGVNEKDIDELKEIIATFNKDKSTLKQKTLKWLGSVSASIAAKGFYDNIPAITDFIQKVI